MKKVHTLVKESTTMLVARNDTIVVIFLFLALCIIGCSKTSSQVEHGTNNIPDSKPIMSPSPHATSLPALFNTVETDTLTISEPEATKTPNIIEPLTTTVLEATINAVRLPPPAETLQFELKPCLADNSNPNVEPSIQWQRLTDNLRQIIGLSYPIESINASMDGRWLIVTLRVDVQNQIPTLSTWMIDTLQEQKLELNSSISGDLHLADWVTETQALWLTQDGDIAIGNGEAFRKLTTPIPMAEVWYAANGVGFTRDIDAAWWRIHIETEQWELINTTDSEPLYGLGLIGISQSKSQALLYQLNNVWHLPLSFGSEATKIDNFDVSHVGTDSGFSPIIIQLSNESGWFIGASIWYPPNNKNLYPLSGFIFNTTEKRLLDNSDFGLPEYYKIVGFSLSPNGEWLTVSLNRSLQVTNIEPTDVYLSQINNPKAGRLFRDVKSIFLGTEYGFLLNDNNTLVALRLGSEDAITIGNAEFLGAGKDTLVVQKSSNHLLIVDLIDNTSQDFELPDGYSLKQVLVNHTGTMYLSLQSDQFRSCQHVLLEYQP